MTVSLRSTSACSTETSQNFPQHEAFSITICSKRTIGYQLLQANIDYTNTCVLLLYTSHSVANEWFRNIELLRRVQITTEVISLLILISRPVYNTL